VGLVRVDHPRSAPRSRGAANAQGLADWAIEIAAHFVGIVEIFPGLVHAFDERVAHLHFMGGAMGRTALGGLHIRAFDWPRRRHAGAAPILEATGRFSPRSCMKMGGLADTVRKPEDP
jgi:hypothetical protein